MCSEVCGFWVQMTLTFCEVCGPILRPCATTLRYHVSAPCHGGRGEGGGERRGEGGGDEVRGM